MAQRKLTWSREMPASSVQASQWPLGSEWDLWIVEEGIRWQQSMRALGERYLKGCAMRCRRVEPRAALAGIGLSPCSVVLWELSPENIDECCPVIAALSRRGGRPLQLVAFVARLGIPRQGYSELDLACRQMGADWVVRQPEDLPLVMRFIHARLSREFKAVGDLDK